MAGRVAVVAQGGCGGSASRPEGRRKEGEPTEGGAVGLGGGEGTGGLFGGGGRVSGSWEGCPLHGATEFPPPPPSPLLTFSMKRGSVGIPSNSHAPK